MDQLAKSGSRALSQVISKTKSNYHLGYQLYTKLFNGCVVPVLDCAAGAWCYGGVTDCTELDRVQHRAIRFFCGLPRQTPISAMTGDMGWIPGVVRRDIEVLRLYNQIVEMPHNRLTRKVFEYDTSNMEQGNTWSKNIKTLLEQLKSAVCWENRSPINLKHAKNGLMDMYAGVWQNEIAQKKKKLYNYSQIKSSFEAVPHVRTNMYKSKCMLLSQLLCGCLPLQIELGRFGGHIPRQKRICKLCEIETESETHFLFRCIATVNTRVNHYHKFPEILNFPSDISKLEFLTKHPFKFGNYVSDLWRE